MKNNDSCDSCKKKNKKCSTFLDDTFFVKDKEKDNKNKCWEQVWLYVCFEVGNANHECRCEECYKKKPTE